MKIYAELTNDNIEDVYKQISNNVKKIRKIKKVTQSSISFAMGFTTPTFYTNAENCKQGKHFNLEHIIKIADYLKVDIAEIFMDIELSEKLTR